MDYDGGPILAIDPNTHTGLCFGRPGERPALSTKHFRTDETDEPEDIHERAVDFFATWFRDDRPSLVVIEAPVPPSQVGGFTNFNTTLITIGIYAIVAGITKCKSIPFMRAPINSWRKHSLGSGRLKGEEAKRRAKVLCRRLEFDAPDHNAAESAGIWLWTVARVAPAQAVHLGSMFTIGAREPATNPEGALL